MPFIDDALLWCPDNDGRMVDISACLPVSMVYVFEKYFVLAFSIYVWIHSEFHRPSLFFIHLNVGIEFKKKN